jgi:hypothetical protein
MDSGGKLRQLAQFFALFRIISHTLRELSTGGIELANEMDLAAVLGPDWPGLDDLLRSLGMSTEPIKTHCEAKCRDGHACKRRVIPGRTRCRNHGGMSTGPRTEAGRQAIIESNQRRAKERAQQRAQAIAEQTERHYQERRERMRG